MTFRADRPPLLLPTCLLSPTALLPTASFHLLQRVLQEESHELGARVEGLGGRVAVVAVLCAPGPGVAAALDRVEGDLGAAPGEPDLVDRARGMRRLGPAAAVVCRPEAHRR